MQQKEEDKARKVEAPRLSLALWPAANQIPQAQIWFLCCFFPGCLLAGVFCTSSLYLLDSWLLTGSLESQLFC